MDQWLVGFKVLSYPERVSCVVCNWRRSIGSIRYPVKARVKPLPSCGPLCVFTNLEDAQSAMRTILIPSYGNISDFIIVRCKYLPSTRIYVWTPTDVRNLNRLFKGTALAEKVMCLE